jgi:hypothetical protein
MKVATVTLSTYAHYNIEFFVLLNGRYDDSKLDYFRDPAFLRAMRY